MWFKIKIKPEFIVPCETCENVLYSFYTFQFAVSLLLSHCYFEIPISVCFLDKNKTRNIEHHGGVRSVSRTLVCLHRVLEGLSAELSDRI